MIPPPVEAIGFAGRSAATGTLASDSPLVRPEDAVLHRSTTIRDLLFRDGDTSVYAVLDGAAIPDLQARLAAASEESECLYRGALGPDLLATAPYLVKLRAEGNIARWLCDEGWGKSWGIYAVTTIGFEALRRHFRGFLRVRDHTGKVLYFRYYDPRVMRLYLPTCNSAEIATVFGGIARFVCEDELATRAIEFPRHRSRILPRVVSLATTAAVA
jgi:hypothetical protein